MSEASKLLRTRPVTEPKKNYVGSLHRIVSDGKRLTLKSTDQTSLWLSLEMPVEAGETQAFDLWVDAKKVNQLFSVFNGGQVSFERNREGNLSLQQGQFKFQVIPQVAPGDVKDMEAIFAAGKLMKTVSKSQFKNVVDWVKGYICTSASDPSRQVATIYNSGLAVAGMDNQIVKATGFSLGVDVSFNETVAATLSSWLGAIKNEQVSVLLTAESKQIVLKEEGTSNYLGMVYDDRKLKDPTADVDLKAICDDTILVDQDWLEDRLGKMQWALEESNSSIQIRIDGKVTPQGADQAAPASLAISVAGGGSTLTNDVLPITRRKTDKTLEFRLDLKLLLGVVQKMEKGNIEFSYSEEAGGVLLETQKNPEAPPTIEKFCMLGLRQKREEKADAKTSGSSSESGATNTPADGSAGKDSEPSSGKAGA